MTHSQRRFLCITSTTYTKFRSGQKPTLFTSQQLRYAQSLESYLKTTDAVIITTPSLIPIQTSTVPEPSFWLSWLGLARHDSSCLGSNHPLLGVAH